MQEADQAQWEHACRAGRQTAYSFSDDGGRLTDYAWFRGNAWDVGEKYAHAVGSRRANAWGLYDLHGNVWESCQDWYGRYPSDSVADPTGAPGGAYRVRRGGAFSNAAWYCRSAYRDWGAPDGRSRTLGFRLSRSLP